MRELSEIQEDVARLADRAGDLKKDLHLLLREIDADHYALDQDVEWAILEHETPEPLPFYLKGLLGLVADEELSELEEELRKAGAMTDGQLLEQWERSGRPAMAAGEQGKE